MQITCQVTGLRITLPSVFHGTNFRALHPVLSLPLAALHKLARTSCSAEDEKILFCAYLFHTGLVQFSAPIDLQKLQESVIAEWLPELPRIAATKDKRNLPKLHVSEDTGVAAIAEWLALVDSALEDTNRLHRSASNREARAIRRTVAIRTRSRELHFDTVLSWAAHYLFARCPEFGAVEKTNRETQEQFLQREEKAKRRDFAAFKAATAVGNANTTPLALLKVWRTRVVEFLPNEAEGPEPAAKQRMILARLDAAILRRIDFMQSIGGANDAETEEMLEEITTNYTISSSAGNFLNTAKDGADALASIAERKTSGTMAALESAIAKSMETAPTAKPLRSAYANELAFQIALLKYNSSNHSNS